ncbi:hypothetical protein J3F84DRAFT_370551, partial [Trichoderma pleuroticola]
MAWFGREGRRRKGKRKGGGLAWGSFFYCSCFFFVHGVCLKMLVVFFFLHPFCFLRTIYPLGFWGTFVFEPSIAFCCLGVFFAFCYIFLPKRRWLDAF